jgi:hypothetical protein
MLMETKERYRMRCAGVALTFRSAFQLSKHADLNVGATIYREQSENVYENKGAVQKSTTPDPSLPKEGNPKRPSSDEEGWGWCDFVTFAYFAPWRETGF